jgi:hypothetical protein
LSEDKIPFIIVTAFVLILAWGCFLDGDDDVEEPLPQNPQLRRELEAQASKATDKGKGLSQRVSRGFHRLLLFVAVFAFFSGTLIATANFLSQVFGLSVFVGLILGLVVYVLLRGVGWAVDRFSAF